MHKEEETMVKRAVNSDGTPTMATDERGILLDLSNREIEQMARREPGSARRYLAERKRQLAALETRQREADERERFIARFLEEGGSSRSAAERAYEEARNETAVAAARKADEEAAAYTRGHINRGVL
jgi:predicted AAA+ superfamily ATPase